MRVNSHAPASGSVAAENAVAPKSADELQEENRLLRASALFFADLCERQNVELRQLRARERAEAPVPTNHKPADAGRQDPSLVSSPISRFVARYLPWVAQIRLPIVGSAASKRPPFIGRH